MKFNSSISKRIKFWDGRNPEFSASIIMTTYMAGDTLEEAVRSIYAQKVREGTTVQLLVGVDPSTDRTLHIAHELAQDAPVWLTVEVFENKLPGIHIGGRKTGRTNFLNCYSRVRSPVLLFLNCDDAWLTDTKLQRQVDHVTKTGRACCTTLETQAPVLKKINQHPEVANPFEHGTGVLFSSFAMPYFRLSNNRLWWTVPFLDLPILCYCWERFGIDRFLDEKTFYRISQNGAWSSQDKYTKYKLIRLAVCQMVLLGPYRASNKLILLRWLRKQKPK